MLRSLELKLADLRTFEPRYEETKAQREPEFQKEASLASRRFLQEVQTATRGVGEKEGFNLILNANPTDLPLSDVVFSKNLDDLTGTILVRPEK
jgi:Skp family chaperone for outer membrane proteins